MSPVRLELLWILPWAIALPAVFLVLQWRRLRRIIRALGPHAVPRLVPVRSAFPFGRLGALCGGALVIGLAAVGFEPTRPPVSDPPAPLDLAIAVDLSLSMNATDTEPTRLSRARDVVSNLTEALPAARTVLVVFADWPYTLVPPTDDLAVVRYFAAALQEDAMIEGDQGTALGRALTHAREALAARPRDGARRAIVILSDGAGVADDVVAAAASSAGDGVRVFTAGVGTLSGSEIEGPSGPVVDPRGTPVVATLDERLLRAIAAEGGGSYHDVTDTRGVDALVFELGGVAPAPDAAADGPWDPNRLLMLAGLLLLLWEGAADAGRWSRAERPRRVAWTT